MPHVHQTWNRTTSLRVVRSKGDTVTIGGIIIPFRVYDAYGTTWDEDSVINAEMFDPHPVLWWHGQDNRERLGLHYAKNLRMMDSGWYTEMDIEVTTPLAERAVALVESGYGAFSTGSRSDLMSFDWDGYCLEWTLVEISIAPIEAVASPDGSTIASIRTQLGVTGMPNGFRRNVQDPQDRIETPPEPSAPTGVTIDEIDERIADHLERFDETLSERMNEFGEYIIEQVPTRSLPAGEELPEQRAARIEVMSPFDEWTVFDMAVAHQIRSAVSRKRGKSMGAFGEDTFYRAMFHKLELEARLDERRIEQAVERRSNGATTVTADWRRAVDATLRRRLHQWMPGMRANEAMGSTVAGYGDELVTEVLGSVAWHVFTLDSKVFGLLRSFVKPEGTGDTYSVPQIISTPRMRGFAEPTDADQADWANSVIPYGRFETSQATWTLGNIGLNMLVPRIMMEDTRVDSLLEASRNIREGMVVSIDDVLLNGDTAATTGNISHLGTDPTGTAYDAYLQLDGLRKLALTADSGNDAAAITTLSVDNTVTLRKLMGARGRMGLDPGKLVQVVDPLTHYGYVELDEFESMADVGPRATLITGTVGMMKGVNQIVSDELENTDTAGKYPAAHNGTKGQQLIMRPEYLHVMIGRNIDLQTEGLVGRELYALSITARISNVVQQYEGCVVAGYNHTV